jgi:hypothetical protein
MDIFVVCCTVKKKEQARIIKTKKQVRKKYKERKRKGIQKIIPVGIRFSAPAQNDPGAHPATYTSGIVFLARG